MFILLTQIFLRSPISTENPGEGALGLQNSFRLYLRIVPVRGNSRTNRESVRHSGCDLDVCQYIKKQKLISENRCANSCNLCSKLHSLMLAADITFPR